jgi:hypothetical protein
MVIGKIKNMSLGNGDMGIYWGYTLDMMGFKKNENVCYCFLSKACGSSQESSLFSQNQWPERRKFVARRVWL